MGAQIGNKHYSGPKQRKSKDESRKRVAHYNAESKHHESVLGIISRLDRVIPMVKHFNQWANEARDQDNRSDYD